MTNTTTTKPRATKKFKALLAYFGSEEQAVAAWNRTNPNNPIGEVAEPALPEAVQQLVDAGFSVEEAQEIVADSDGEPVQPAPLTSKEIADALVEERGMTFTKGRVYSNTALIEAQVRVLKTGKPEIVNFSGEQRTKGVVVFRTDDGSSVAMQNLGEQHS